MTLTFLSPAFLWLLAALPLVVALHFLRSRRRRVDVSAMFLWQRARTTMARRRVFTPTWLLAAQLLFTAMAAVALARPALVPAAVPDRVVIVDASASMAAIDGALTRFDRAVEVARPLVDGSGRVALIRAGLDARLEAPLDATALQRQAALDALRPGDAAADMGRALALAEALLPGADVHIVSDQDLTVGRAELHRVGAPAQNVGISALDVGIGQVFVAVVASGNLPVEVEVELFRDGENLASGSVLVPSNGAGSITFPLDDLGGIIEARLVAPPGDALALDDVAFTGSRPVTVVTDDDHGALTRALEAVPNTTVRYSVGARLLEADLKVLTRGFVGGQAQGDDLARGNYLVFAPAAAEPVFQVVRDWDRAHPLLRFVDLRDLVVGLDPARQPLSEDDGWRVLARTADLTPVLRVREADGVWQLEAAFHPSQTDLVLRPAFPALVTNVVSQVRTTTRVRLGEGLPGGVTVLGADGRVALGALLEPGVFQASQSAGSAGADQAGADQAGADRAGADQAGAAAEASDAAGSAAAETSNRGLPDARQGMTGGTVVLASLLAPGESRLEPVGTAVTSAAAAGGVGSVAQEEIEGDGAGPVRVATDGERRREDRSGGAFTTAAYVLVGLALAALVAEWLMFSGMRLPFVSRRPQRAA